MCHRVMSQVWHVPMVSVRQMSCHVMLKLLLGALQFFYFFQFSLEYNQMPFPTHLCVCAARYFSARA